MQGDMEGISPYWSNDLIGVNGKLARLHKGGSGAATAEARKGREQSAAQFAEQMALMKRQQTQAEAQQEQAIEASKRPVSEPAPTTLSADTASAATAARRAASKRKGMAYSLFTQPKAPTVGTPTLLA